MQRENRVARRQLLTVGVRRRLFDPTADETAIIRHYTLSSEDMELASRRYGPANRLGLAAQLALMRHPGFGLQAETGRGALWLIAQGLQQHPVEPQVALRTKLVEADRHRARVLLRPGAIAAQ